MTATNVRLWVFLGFLSALPAVVSGQPLPVTDEIVQVLEARQRASVVPEAVCAMKTLPFPADQDGYQEIEPRLGPSTYVARFAVRFSEARKTEERRQEIERLDFLASVGLLQARDAVITRGFIETDIPSREYKLTLAGWLAGLGECLHLGRVELLRALDYTESAPGPNGYRTLKVRTLVGVRYPPEWARSDAARRLFPVIRQQHEGVEREQTLYRDPQGRIDTANTYIGSLKHLYSADQVRARDSISARLTIEDANKILASIPVRSGRAEGHALPEACLELFPGHTAQSPSLFTREADGRFALQLPKTMSGSGAEYAMLYAQARAKRLADAGLVALEGDGTQTKLRLLPPVAELVAKHGSCVPLGETRIELVGIGYASDQGPRFRPRIHARAQAIPRAAWTTTMASLWLPEMALLLSSGLYFEVDVAWYQARWNVERVRSLAPAWVLPRLDAIGDSRAWHGGYLRQRGISAMAPSVRRYPLHVLSAYEGTPSAERGPEKREIEVDVRPLPGLPVIVLSAYGRTEWRFRVAPGTRIGAVMAMGYYPQTLVGLPENVPVVSAATILDTAANHTALGRIRRIEYARPTMTGGSTVITLGRGGPTTSSPGAQIIQRGSKEHLVVPHGVQITEKAPGEYEIKELERGDASEPVAPEFLAKIRDFFGVAPATVQHSYTGSRFVVDGREGLRTDGGEKK